MSSEVRQLEPKAVWNYFEDLNEVPRPSKKEEKVIAFAKAFGESLGLDTKVDGIGNVVIKKPATSGMEDKPTVVLQSHLDMVHQKNNDTDFDFSTDGIQSYIDGEWVKAKGTTLGADNGMGVAAIMAVLASDNIKHPAVEALFTIDEETGMTGAMKMDGSLISGRILLNLDTEDDDELCIGCAGGIDTNVTGQYPEEDVLEGRGFKITVTGLNGGHSGMDIHKGLGNANKIMNRLLYRTLDQFGLRVSSIDGGGLRNAIPRESNAIVVINYVEAFKEHFEIESKYIKNEYATMEPNLEITLKPCETPEKVMAESSQTRLLNAIYVVPNGVYRMSPDIPELVETSNSLARVLVNDGEFMAQCLTRSSVDSAKMDLANAIRASFEMIETIVEQGGAYPGWAPMPNAPILHTMKKLYTDMFNEDPNVQACHAGLECGIIGEHFDEMHMISFGPTIRGAHSPDEKVKIESVQKFWKFLVNTLENIPHMN